MRAQRPYKTYVSPVTADDASPMTVAVQSRQSWYQGLVLWQAQRLAFDTVDNLTLHHAHMVALTTHCCYHEPFLCIAVLKCHILILSPAITPVGQWVLVFS